MKNLLATIALVAVVFASISPLAAAQGTTTDVANETPTVGSVSVAASVSPTTGATTAVSVTVTASDPNGYQDLSSVSVTVYKPDGTTVHVAAATATSNADGSGTSQTYAYGFNMQFHDDPALGATTYKVSATATDVAAATSTATVATFNYAELAALQLSASTIDFGTLNPGSRSATSTLTVTNHGNVAIDIATNGTALSDGAGHSIAVSNVKYDLAASNMAAEVALTATPFTNTFGLAKGASSTKASYWQVAVPSGSAQYIPGGTYTGTITVSAVKAA